MHLGRENLPEYMIGDLVHHDLLHESDQRTGSILLHISFMPIVFRNVILSLRAQGKFLSKIVMCDLEFSMDGEKARGDIAVSFDVFSQRLQGQLPLSLNRLKPFPAKAALAYLFHMHKLEGGTPCICLQVSSGTSIEIFCALEGSAREINQ